MAPTTCLPKSKVIFLSNNYRSCYLAFTTYKKHYFPFDSHNNSVKIGAISSPKFTRAKTKTKITQSLS